MGSGIENDIQCGSDDEHFCRTLFAGTPIPSSSPAPARHLLDHERAVVTYVPRTTSMRQTRFEVPHQAPGFDAGAFDAQSTGSVPDVRLVRRLGMVPASTLAEIERAVKAWLALP